MTPAAPTAQTVDLDALVAVVDFLHRRPLTRQQATKFLQQLPDTHPAKDILERDPMAKLAWALAESAQYHRTTSRLLLLAYKLGVRPRQNAIEGVVHRLAVAGRWGQVPPAVALARRLLGRVTKRLLNWKTRALVECGEWGQVEQMLREFHEADHAPDRRTWHMLVQASLLNSNLPRARDYLAGMERAGFPADDSTHVAIVTAYHVLGQKDDVEGRAFETLRGRDPASDTRVLNSIMQLRMRHGDLDAMCRVFRVFTVQCNIRMTGVEMRLIGKPNKKDPVYRPEFEGDYDHVHHTIVRPNAATFAMIMEVLAHQEQIDQVERAYNIMRLGGIVPDASTVTAFIKAFANVGDFKAALGVFMRTCGTDAMAAEFARFLHVKQTKMPSSPVPPGLSHVPLDIRIYNALLSALLPSCGVLLFQISLEHMRVFNVEPNRQTGNILLHYLANRGHTPRQLIRITSLFANFPPHCRPTIGYINSILAAIMRRRRPVQQQLKSADNGAEPQPPRLEPDADPYDPSAGLASPRNAEFVELLALIAGRQIRSNSSTFALRLWRDAVTKLDMDSARETFREMNARGIRPNSRHFTILMDGFTRVGNVAAAEEIMALAFKENNVLPNVVMYSVLIKGYARIRRPALASRTFFRMIQAGIPPDIKAVLSLVDAFIVAKRYRFAKKLLLSLWRWVIELPPNVSKKEFRRADLWSLRRTFANSDAAQYVKPTPRERDRRLMRRRIALLLRQWREFYEPTR